MDTLIAYLILAAVLAWLAVRTARSDDRDRSVQLLAEVFFLALVLWVVSSLARTLLARQGWVPDVVFEIGQPAGVVAAACFVALAFLLMLRSYRR